MRAAIILVALVCTGCSRYVQNSLATISSQAQNALDRGQLHDAASLSRRGLLLAASFARHDWEWKFRCLSAETLNLERKPLAAIEALTRTAGGPDPQSEEAVRIQIDLGISRIALGRLDQAETNLNAAALLCRRSENAPWSAALSLRQGMLAYNHGRQKEAESLLERAVVLAKHYDQLYVLANARTYMGRIMLDSGRYGRVVEWLGPAVEISRQRGYLILLETNLNNLGLAYYNLGNLDSALLALKEAEVLTGRLQRPSDRQAALTTIGAIYEERQDFLAQADFNARALALARTSNNPKMISECLHNVATSFFNASDFEAAKRFNDEELVIKRANHDQDGEPYGLYLRAHLEEQSKQLHIAEADFQKVIARTEPAEGEKGKRLALHWEALISLANVHAAENRIEAADEDYRKAIEAFELARAHLSTDEFKMTFRSKLGRHYNVYIRFLMTQGRELDALRVAELSRAQVLSTQFGAEDSAVLDIPNLKAKAKSLHATILSYWLAPRASYLWVITATDFAAIKLPDGKSITQLADAYRLGIISSSKNLDSRLYEMLVRPAERYIPYGSRVIIIPDASLYQLNFETLLVPGKPVAHYWIEDVTISTANSLSLLSPVTRKGQVGNILLIGDPASPAPQFPRLPNTSVELHRIADRFPPDRKSVYEGGRALPSTYFKANPGAFSWIHFAAHGIADQANPLDSAIILSNENDSYKLYARDIARVALHADLVTISACYGSGTRVYAGEGIVGLAWSFLRAGAHNVIASLWEANDYYTTKLMEHLYERLIKGDDPATALREAKLTLLRSEYADRNPRYWGAFQLYTGR